MRDEIIGTLIILALVAWVVYETVTAMRIRKGRKR